MTVYYFFYSTVMKIAHKFNWHYAPPIYPEGDTHLWCQWCGFRQTVKKSKKVGIGSIPKEAAIVGNKLK